MAELGAADRLTTILPGAVFGPVLSKENLGSVRIIQTIARWSSAGIAATGLRRSSTSAILPNYTSGR